MNLLNWTIKHLNLYHNVVLKKINRKKIYASYRKRSNENISMIFIVSTVHANTNPLMYKLIWPEGQLLLSLAVPFQNYIWQPTFNQDGLHGLKLKIWQKKIIKNLLHWNYLANRDQTSMDWPLRCPLSKLYSMILMSFHQLTWVLKWEDPIR